MKKEKRKFKDTIFYTLLMSIVFMLVVPIVISIPLYLFDIVPENPTSVIGKITEEYLIFTGITLLSFVILFSLKENKDLRKLFNFKNHKILSGLCIGFLLNLLCAFIAYIFGYVKFGTGDYNILIFLYAFVCVAVQSASEEVVCRGYIYGKVLKDYKSPMFAIMINSIVFSLFHIGNDGIGIIALLSIFTIGVFLSLLTYYNGNIWEAIAFHTMWNFTQNFLLGLPNSGLPAMYSLFRVTEAKSGIVYDKVFGVEATIVAVLVSVVAIVVIQLIHKKDKKKVNVL